jgi:hypothetical protein
MDDIDRYYQADLGEVCSSIKSASSTTYFSIQTHIHSLFTLQEQQSLQTTLINMLSNTKNIVAPIALLALVQHCPAPFLAAIPPAVAAGVGTAVSHRIRT